MRVAEVACVGSVVVVRGFLLGEASASASAAAAAVVLASASSCARFFEDLLVDLSLDVFDLRAFGVSMAASADIVEVWLVQSMARIDLDEW